MKTNLIVCMLLLIVMWVCAEKRPEIEKNF